MRKKTYFSITHIVILSFAILSCSHINKESQKEYDKKHPFRHGILPIVDGESKKSKNIRVIDAKAVKRGKVLYQENCLHCHGSLGRGHGPQKSELELGRVPKDLSKVAREVPNFKFYMILSKWKGKMPGWKNMFSEQDIFDLENYITHLGQK